MAKAQEALIGKTIVGIVEAENERRSPHRQTFFIFADGTYFELWGELYSIGTLDRGGLKEVLEYAESTMGARVLSVHPEILVQKADATIRSLLDRLSRQRK